LALTNPSSGYASGRVCDFAGQSSPYDRSSSLERPAQYPHNTPSFIIRQFCLASLDKADLGAVNPSLPRESVLRQTSQDASLSQVLQFVLRNVVVVQSIVVSLRPKDFGGSMGGVRGGPLPGGFLRGAYTSAVGLPQTVQKGFSFVGVLKFSLDLRPSDGEQVPTCQQ
jgi:hypothetical protein